MTQLPSTGSLRRLYLEWVEEQIEDFKESVPRSELLRIADEVVADLEMTGRGQYQLTELLLLEEVDRKIVKRLKLPSFRAWTDARAESLRTLAPKRPPLDQPVDVSENLPASV